MKIISILGKSGSDTLPYYKNSSNLEIKEGEYRNLTDLILKNYQGRANILFLGTKEAIEEQSKMTSVLVRELSVEFNDANLDDIFSKTLNALKEYNGEIVLDITHGFRHLPLISALSTSVATILYEKRVRIIFAKEVESRKLYEIINLDSYIEINTTTYLLITFLKKLTIPDVYTDETLIISLRDFCQTLHSNNLHKLFESALADSRREIEKAKNSEKYYFMKELFTDLEKILNRFEFAKNRENHEKFYILSTLMRDKDYLLISVAYLFEACNHYIYDRFKKRGYLKEESADFYNVSKSLAEHIARGSKCPYLRHLSSNDYKINGKNFAEYTKLRDDCKKIRNSITHLSMDFQENDLRSKLNELLERFYDSFIERDIFNSVVTQKR